jgi:hypothetical protein
MLNSELFAGNLHFHSGNYLSESSADEITCHDPALQILEALIREGAALKHEIDAKMARFRSINQLLAENASFKSGQKTTSLIGGGYKVKIRLHENVTWDQERIATFSRCLPDEKFRELFKTIYEPTSKRTIDGFLAHANADLSGALRWCMSVKPGTPQVTYEKLD